MTYGVVLNEPAISVFPFALPAARTSCVLRPQLAVPRTAWSWRVYEPGSRLEAADIVSDIRVKNT